MSHLLYSGEGFDDPQTTSGLHTFDQEFEEFIPEKSSGNPYIPEPDRFDEIEIFNTDFEIF
jgi:hypothetical protein